MMIRHGAVTTALVMFAMLGGVAMAADAAGVWDTGGGKARVRVSHCGNALCGTIISLRNPLDPATGRPKTDKFNADASKRSRPMIGVQVLLDMKPTGTPGKWAGEVYNAEDGKTYSGYLTLTGANSLELQGCVMAIFCKSQTWTRAR